MYYLSERNYNGQHAGVKARNDAEYIFQKSGLQPLNRHQIQIHRDCNGLINTKFKSLRSFFLLHSIKSMKNQRILIQYPILGLSIGTEELKSIVKRNKVVFLVHDVHSLKNKDTKGLSYEIELLNLADSLILHNQDMLNVLVSNGLIDRKTYFLGVFDYLLPEEFEIPDFKDLGTRTVAFAGNLDKSLFLDDLVNMNRDISFRIYGPSSDESFINRLGSSYKGSYGPEEIVLKLEGHFGLVWDGQSVYENSGLFGDYQQYNSPHKVSLYIAAGLPIIVSKKAAVAKFIEDNRIGVLVDDLVGLDSKLMTINQSEYSELKRNVSRVRDELISGQRLSSIINSLQREG